MDNNYYANTVALESFYFLLLDSTGPIGYLDFHWEHSERDLGINMYNKRDYSYAIGFTIDSTFSYNLRHNTCKIETSTWDIV